MNFKIIVAFFLGTYLLNGYGADATIGVNFGRQNNQRLLSSNVVDLMLQNGIREARLFTTEEEFLWAFAGSGIGLTLTISNINNFKTIKQANFWIQAKKKYFKISNLRMVYVADGVFSFLNKVVINDAIQVLQSNQQVLNDEGFGDQVKVTIPHNRGILKINKTSLRPSETEFMDEIKPEMITLLRLLQQNNAPFVFAMTTIGDIQEFGLDLNFAFVDNKSGLVINDINGAVYTNAFELMYDSFIWALIKLNASDLRVIVSHVGWPTDGYIGANTTMAERYYKSLLPFVSSNKGTPMRPGAPIDIYINSFTDENKMPVFGNAFYTRHMGIYMSNGMPKYKIDLSGKGRDIYPAESRGIKRMPNRWCVFSGEISNIEKLKSQVEKACIGGDCTSMEAGGSCSHLGFPLNVSYAFNVYFQARYQNETECELEGLGHVTTEDPSTPECVFPVDVVRPEEQPPNYAYLFSAAGRTDTNSLVFVILFSVLGTMLYMDLMCQYC